MATPSRWAPWIEPRVSSTGNLTVNGTGYTLIPGCTLTFTPHVNARLQVPVKVDAQLTIAGAGILNVQLFINTVGHGAVLAYGTATVGDRVPCSEVFHIDLVKETTYTLELMAALSAVGATYLVVGNAGRSAMGPIVAMRNLYT